MRGRVLDQPPVSIPVRHWALGKDHDNVVTVNLDIAHREPGGDLSSRAIRLERNDPTALVRCCLAGPGILLDRVADRIRHSRDLVVELSLIDQPSQFTVRGGQFQVVPVDQYRRLLHADPRQRRGVLDDDAAPTVSDWAKAVVTSGRAISPADEPNVAVTKRGGRRP